MTTDTLEREQLRKGDGTGALVATAPTKSTARARPQGSAPAPAANRQPSSSKPHATLGEIVQRNQKLNDWLNQMLADEAQDSTRTQPNPKNVGAKKPNGRKA
jgi:hypothetical protein